MLGQEYGKVVSSFFSGNGFFSEVLARNSALETLNLIVKEMKIQAKDSLLLNPPPQKKTINSKISRCANISHKFKVM